MASKAEKPNLSLKHLLGDSYNPKQAEFILSPEYEVAWVGGMGCGKTYALCAAAFRHAAKYPGANILISRLTFRELIDSTKKQFYEMVDNKNLRGMFVRPKKWDYREGTNNCRLVNGSEITFANLEPGRLDKLKNLEFSFVGIDQGEEIQFDTYQLLLQRCRLTAVPHTDRHVVVIANDEGDNWLRRRFLTFEAPHNRPTIDATRRLIRGSSLENPHLDAGARAQLLSLPPEVQARWVYAEMNAGSNRLLPDFRIVDPIEIPRHWPRWMGCDPARSTGVTCAIWVTVNPDKEPYKGIAPNAPHIYQEYWADGRDAEDHAEAINRLTGPHVLRGRVMDRTAWHSALSSRKASVVSVAQLYINAGLPVMPSEGDEWARVMLFLEAHRRGLTVSRACPNLIRQSPEYRIKGQQAMDSTGQMKELKIVAKQKFHAVDAGGYALSVIPSRVAPVDVREVLPMYEIPEHLDEGSRKHWERERSRLPMRKGNDPVITLGFDEAEFHRDDVSPSYDGEVEDAFHW